MATIGNVFAIDSISCLFKVIEYNPLCVYKQLYMGFSKRAIFGGIILRIIP